MNNRTTHPLNPRIIVLSSERSRDGKHVEIKLQNHDEKYEGYVNIQCAPLKITIDRFYLQKWHQCRLYVTPISSYDSQLVWDVLIRYKGQNRIMLHNGSWAEYPIFEIDKDMIEVVTVICKEYVSTFAMTIQKYVRGYFSRRRYNINRVRCTRELRALPPGAITSFFPGGTDYHTVALRYLRK